MALFFKQRKSRGFNYIPRYYNPEKEAREDRKRVVLGEKYKDPAEAESEYTPGKFIRSHVNARRNLTENSSFLQKRRRKQKSVTMLLMMLFVLVLIAWLMYVRR